MGPDGVAQLTCRTMCDRIVVFDAPVRLVGRLVDIDIHEAGAWVLTGNVADGLAEAVPLEELPLGGGFATNLYDISLPHAPPRPAAAAPEA